MRACLYNTILIALSQLAQVNCQEIPEPCNESCKTNATSPAKFLGNTEECYDKCKGGSDLALNSCFRNCVKDILRDYEAEKATYKSPTAVVTIMTTTFLPSTVVGGIWSKPTDIVQSTYSSSFETRPSERPVSSPLPSSLSDCQSVYPVAFPVLFLSILLSIA